MTETTIKCENAYGEGTIKVNQEINAIVIFSPTKSQIKIISELGYKIFENECEGVNYIPLRVQGIDPTGKRINFSAEKYVINEKVKIEVRQTMKTDLPTKIIFR